MYYNIVNVYIWTLSHYIDMIPYECGNFLERAYLPCGTAPSKAAFVARLPQIVSNEIFLFAHIHEKHCTNIWSLCGILFRLKRKITVENLTQTCLVFTRSRTNVFWRTRAGITAKAYRARDSTRFSIISIPQSDYHGSFEGSFHRCFVFRSFSYDERSCSFSLALERKLKGNLVLLFNFAK